MEAITGVNVIGNVGNAVYDKFVDWGWVGTPNDNKPQQPQPQTTLPETTTKVETTTEVEQTTEQTTIAKPQTTTQKATTKGHIDIFEAEDDDETTTVATTTTQPTTQITTEVTTNKTITEQTTQQETTTKKEPTTVKPVIEQTTQKEQAKFVSMSVDYSNMKTNYIYGEKLSYDGIDIVANYIHSK